MAEEVYYESSRLGRVAVSRMAVPHAARSLASLPADAPAELRAALTARAGLAEAVATGVPMIGGGHALRAPDGRIAGAYHRGTYWQPRPAPAVSRPPAPVAARGTVDRARSLGRLIVAALVAVALLALGLRRGRRRTS